MLLVQEKKSKYAPDHNSMGIGTLSYVVMRFAHSNRWVKCLIFQTLGAGNFCFFGEAQSDHFYLN